MKQRKAAIGLSINFIVILIISITVFGFSIYFINRIYSGATKTQETYYQQFDNQMESLACDSLDRVCVGKNTKTIGKGNVAVFTMKILNVGVTYNPGTPNFQISSSAIKTSCRDPPGYTTNICKDKFDLSLAENYEIPENEARSLIIAISPKSGSDAPLPGTYLFDVVVNPPSSYASEKQKVYVVVP